MKYSQIKDDLISVNQIRQSSAKIISDADILYYLLRVQHCIAENLEKLLERISLLEKQSTK
jgi:hypothetical protein